MVSQTQRRDAGSRVPDAVSRISDAVSRVSSAGAGPGRAEVGAAAGAAGALFGGYAPLAGSYDECFGPDRRPRPEAERVLGLFEALGRREFRAREQLAQGWLLGSGVSYSAYRTSGAAPDPRGTAPGVPLDLLPRIVPARDWRRLRAGAEQRLAALNAFLADVYGEQRILAAGILPPDLVLGSRGYLPALKGVRPPAGVHVHVAGIDVIRDAQGAFRVLEDNLRAPPPVALALESRLWMRKLFPALLQQAGVHAIDDYPLRLRSALGALAAAPSGAGALALLGASAAEVDGAEDGFLARRMGCPLLETRDLILDGDRVCARTTHGPQPVDVLYRLGDDEGLDPALLRAYAAGRVVLANAPGSGVADDKALYPFVPDMIRYYLSEEPLLPQLTTYLCAREPDRRHVLANLASLVLKPASAVGGAGGVHIGAQATRRELAELRRRIRAEPRGWIAQPRMEVSTSPCANPKGIAPRRVDLRLFAVSGPAGSWLLPGGLTRAALAEGSYAVSPSRGGGIKDTWVLEGGA